VRVVLVGCPFSAAINAGVLRKTPSFRGTNLICTGIDVIPDHIDSILDRIDPSEKWNRGADDATRPSGNRNASIPGAFGPSNRRNGVIAGRDVSSKDEV
jgi:hypothetical protein